MSFDSDGGEMPTPTRKRDLPPHTRKLIAAGLICGSAVLGAFGWTWAGKLSESGRADNAVQQGQDVQADAKTLARGIEAECAKGKAVSKAIQPYCPKAKEVIAQPPIEGKPGKDGEKGDKGDPGLPGAQGTPGKDGTSGTSGTSATQPPPGADGSPGADSTVAGPSGPSGPPGATVTGPMGPSGPTGPPGATITGPPGRGIVSITCETDAHWVFVFTFTYSDGDEQRITCGGKTPDPTPTDGGQTSG